ncbi:MAG: hypothetical protein Q8Q23_00855 [bacterium]|nr:hypothetical protein [bacterium]
MPKILLLIFISLVLSGCLKGIENTAGALTGINAVEQKLQADADIALIQARQVYRQAVLDGVDLSSGPCLSNNLIPGWVLDIAHNPRQAIDNNPANQCPAYRDGAANHFIEMDVYGTVIKSK